MQQLIAQATTEKKKRLSLDVVTDAHTSEEGVQVETHLTFEENGKEEQQQIGEDEIFEMFDKLLENEEQQQQQQETVVIATNEKKEKSKKAKKSDNKEKAEKAEKKAEKKKDDKLSKKEAAALKKKAEEEEAALKKKAEVVQDNDEETEGEEEEEELECEEYEYDGETYGLAPNGDIYSQDGDLVGKLTNGVPEMFK